MVEGRQKAEGRGQKVFPIITLILYTNDATGHDITCTDRLITEVLPKYSNNAWELVRTYAESLYLVGALTIVIRKLSAVRPYRWCII
ncbi:MAG: hypothetical protein F6K17_05130 [Okeania sp. SIO3C4]|nr:hypothetical protein [Okeania sp. SIO3C4]